MRWDLIGEYNSKEMKHATFTLDENIEFMEQAVDMAKNKEKTCKEWNIKEDDFICWMMGTLDSCSKDLKLIAAE